MWTVSPARAPARARALSTPRARRRRWASSSASALVRSDSATARSAWRPTTVHAPSSSALDPVALGHGPVHDEGLGLRQLGPGALHGLGHLARPAARSPSPVTAAIRWPVERRRRARRGRRATRPRAAGGRAGRAGSAAARRAGSAPARPAGAGASGDRSRSTHEHPGPLDVAQELVAEAPALAGALDEAGEVGDDELGVVVEAHHAEVRLEGGERVVGDLRLGRRDRRDQRGLADAREARRGRRRPSA